MAPIKAEDFITSIADSLQYISYYHPVDFVRAMTQAYEREKSGAARDAIGQILINSRMCALGKRPICQDTGIVTVFVKLGMNCRFEGDLTIQQLVDEGVTRAYGDPSNPLRKSIVADPAGSRINTKTNAPAVVHVEMVPGDAVEVQIAAKGGGSENKSKMAMLTPADSIVDWVKKTVPAMGAGWCPPGILGIGIGGTIDKAMCLAKQSLMDPIDIDELRARGPANRLEELRLQIFDEVNALGIGAQGLGGLTTVLDVKILDYPTHAASLPVAMIPNCAAARHTHFTLDGSGPAVFTPPSLDEWPQIAGDDSGDARQVNLDGISKEEIASWKAGDTLLLSGKILTGRDAAHRRIQQLLDAGQPLPEGVDFNGRFIYYVGPVDPVGDEVVGPAGPTTSTRMDKYTAMMLGKTGLYGMIGKAERGDATIELIKRHGAVYLMAVGGAAYLVAKAITASRVVAFADLGMEAIYEFEVKDMPVTVAVDAAGEAVHKTGPTFWQQEIAKLRS
ncbi:fumarate hydratase [Desulfofustis limnaeus]|jgi:fumarate hydratase class I|uniref:Fumarate hydratase class I n=1 Tax=Desulfofustis limnaeus TaxID=2740163 RepID=A0ABN6M6R4_9BACT|nr:fumarate hydratase [Desulfofustis limnaeus]MDX9896899.1 fumarate hydratase [Desulfofustis sp.]BDD86817.1 fumarate hydratase class I [Desulfofustis limnaeus]